MPQAGKCNDFLLHYGIFTYPAFKALLHFNPGVSPAAAQSGCGTGSSCSSSTNRALCQLLPACRQSSQGSQDTCVHRPADTHKLSPTPYMLGTPSEPVLPSVHPPPRHRVMPSLHRHYHNRAQSVGEGEQETVQNNK